MTDEEFDNTAFRKGDRIEVRHYFKTEVEDVEYVNVTIYNFTQKKIN